MAHKVIDKCEGCMYAKDIYKNGEWILVCTTGKNPAVLFCNNVCLHLKKKVCQEFFCQDCKTCDKNK